MTDHREEEQKQMDTEVSAGSKAEADENKTEQEVSEEQVEDLDVEELQEQLQEKDQKIEELQAQLDETSDSLLRKAAELENYRKRMRKEKEKVQEDAKVKALDKFLPINDDLKRTLEASENLEVDPKFLDGIQMVSRKFDEVLEEYDVERIDETMVPFDVNLHDAMMRQPAKDKNMESNTVLQVMESGYKIGDRVIRHAKVIVSE